MEGLTACCFGAYLPRCVHRNLSMNRRRPGHFITYASSDIPKFNKWDQMELKFGRLLGEDPKLTLAKIMARKDDPYVSYLDVEKSFRRSKGKLHDMFNMPTDVLLGEELPSSQNQGIQDLSKQGKLNLNRPVLKNVNKSKMLEEKPVFGEAQNDQLTGDINNKTPTCKISLRRPSVFLDKGIEADSSKFKIVPTASPTQNYSEVTLLKKPEVVQVPSKPFNESIACENPVDISFTSFKATDNVNTLDKVESEDVIQQNNFERHADYDIIEAKDNESKETSVGLQPSVQKDYQQFNAKISGTSLHENSISSKVSVYASLLEKPSRQEDSDRVLHPTGSEAFSSNEKAYCYSADIMKFQSAEEGGHEHHDWRRAENILKLGERAQVEVISSSSRGFVASFDSLIGFLPYRNFGTKWKYMAFESWLRKNGLDPSTHSHNLSIVGNNDGRIENPAFYSNYDLRKDKEISLLDMKFEELLEAYEQEKTKYLSSFVGQRLRVSVILADRSSRKLIFSGRPKENEELVKKKRTLMARLNVGDIIRCCIKKITYLGIFIEVEGVPALIHQSEVPWDMTLNPSSYFKIGQVVDAKVHQLDFALERITLSLKEVAPDRLMECLESVGGGGTSLCENIECAQTDIEILVQTSLDRKAQGCNFEM